MKGNFLFFLGITSLCGLSLTSCLNSVEMSTKNDTSTSEDVSVFSSGGCPLNDWGFLVDFRTTDLPNKISIVVNNEAIVDECQSNEAALRVFKKRVNFKRHHPRLLEVTVTDAGILPEIIDITLNDLGNCKEGTKTVYSRNQLQLFYEKFEAATPTCGTYYRSVRPRLYKTTL